MRQEMELMLQSTEAEAEHLEIKTLVVEDKEL